MQNFRPFASMRSPGDARKPLRTDGWTNGQMDSGKDRLKNGHRWSDGPKDPCTCGKRVFRVSDGGMDGWTTRKHNASGA